MYLGGFFFSLTDLNGDILEGSWPSYGPDSALFSLWINRELQSARPSIWPLSSALNHFKKKNSACDYQKHFHL